MCYGCVATTRAEHEPCGRRGFCAGKIQGRLAAVRALFPSALVLGVLAGLGVSVPLVVTASADDPIMRADEVRPGDKGYGLTVFRGTDPERFDVEVIDVLHSFQPGQDLILVKTEHPRLAVAKVVAGMSGSPVFIRGKLIGAYAYSMTSFPSEAVAGVTPITNMLAELRRAIPPGLWPAGGSAPLPGKKTANLNTESREEVPSPTRYDGPISGWSSGAHRAQVAARLGPGALGDAALGLGVSRVATPIMAGGLDGAGLRDLAGILAPFRMEPYAAGTGAGTSNTDSNLTYVDGGAIGVLLASGDVSLMGLGTVTHVVGQKLCAFGHPMMGSGNVAWPTAVGKVLWIYASQQRSVKVGEPVRPLGTLVQDRPSAVVADLTKTPPQFSVHIAVKGGEGAPKNTWNVSIAEDRFLGPQFLGVVLRQAIGATISEKRNLAIEVEQKVTIEGHGTISLLDEVVTATGTEGLDWNAADGVRLVAQVLSNPWEKRHIERVDVTLNVRYESDAWRVRGVSVSEPRVEAGSTVHVNVLLEPLYGPAVVRTVAVPIPESLGGRDIDIEIANGAELVPDRPNPESLAQLLVNAAIKAPSIRTLAASIRLPSQGLLLGPHVARDLPPFALDALRPSTSDFGPAPFVSRLDVVVPVEHAVVGRDHVRLSIKPKHHP